MKEIAMFVENLKVRGKSPATLRTFPANINEFCKMMEVDSFEKLATLKVADYNRYLSMLEDNGNGANTRNTKLSAVNSFCEFLVKIDLLDKNVIGKVDRAKTPSRISIQPTPEEAKLILNSVKRRPKLFTLYSLLMNSGLRIEECLMLRLSDFRDGMIMVRGGKGDKDRIVPLNASCTELLTNYIENHRKVWTKEMLMERHDGDKKMVMRATEDSDLIFLGKNGLRMYNNNLNVSLTHTAEVCGLDKSVVHPHAFRHYFATEFVKQGGDVTQLQKILGHASLKTTQIYFETNMDKIKETMSRMSF